MPHQIIPSTSGRAKCRGCKTAIEKDTLRFGEEVPNAFGEGQATHWYHLQCGARRRPEAFHEALDAFVSTEISSEDRLIYAELCRLGSEFPRLARFVNVHVAPSGRARCQGCHELIGKGELRFVLERVEDGMVAGAGFVHVGCAHTYAGSVAGLLDRVRGQGELSAEEWEQVELTIGQQAELPQRKPTSAEAGPEIDASSAGS